MTVDELPDGAVFVRVTPDFDERTVPAGLRSAHRVADGVWGRLVVRSGTLDVVFEDAAHVRHAVAAGGAKVLPPGARHHVELVGPVRFAVEFHRVPSGDATVDTVAG
jgi:tellurite methyltransferase